MGGCLELDALPAEWVRVHNNVRVRTPKTNGKQTAFVSLSAFRILHT